MKAPFHILYFDKNGGVRSFYGNLAKHQEEGGVMFENWDDGRQLVSITRSCIKELRITNVETT